MYILNTRPIEQGLALNQAIAAIGGTAIPLPLLAIKPTHTLWKASLPALDQVNFMLFTSTNAVDFFLREIHPKASTQIIAIGKATAQRLSEKGLRVDAIPSVATSEHLLELTIFNDCQQKIALLIKGKNGRELIQQTLEQRGMTVIPIDVYERVPLQYPVQLVENLWREDKLDIILFTSQEGMDNFFSQLPIQYAGWVKSKHCVVLSQRLADVAHSYGMERILVASHDALIDCFIRLRGNLL